MVLWSVMRGLFRHHARLYMLWCLTVTPPALLPGAVALAAPALYHSARGRGREAVIVCSKLLAAALYPLFRLAWHAPGMPLDVQAGVGGRATLPLQPLALAQCGAVLLLFASFRHPLRFKAQMLCQMALLVVVLQAETVRRPQGGPLGPSAPRFSSLRLPSPACPPEHADTPPHSPGGAPARPGSTPALLDLHADPVHTGKGWCRWRLLLHA